MIKTSLPFIFFILGIICQAQTFPSTSLSKTEYNSSSDPLINIIDPNGAKQGSWYYISNTSEIILKEEYTNNNLVARFIKNPFTQKWETFSIGSKDTQNIILQALQSNQLLLLEGMHLVIITNGIQTDVYFLGQCTDANSDNAKQIIINTIQGINIKTDSYEYIFI